MDIKGVIIKTAVRYKQDDDELYRSSGVPYSVLEIEVPIPGGKASYEVSITDDMKDSLEHAVSLIPLKDR